MYGRRDKERILADLAESGMPPAAFAALPGRPCRSTLRKWIREAERGEIDVPERGVRGRADGRAKHERYPEATVREALRLLARGARPADVARRLGVSSGSVVRSWATRAAARGRISPEGVVRVDGDGLRDRVAELERELAAERLANAALRELARDPKAGDPASLSNRQKVGLGERLRREHGYRQSEVRAFLGISKSSYAYALRSLERAEARGAEVARRVRACFDASGGTYGYRRVRAALALGADGGEPMAASEREVRRAMRDGGMVARRTRARRSWSSYGGETDPRPPNAPLRPDGTHDFSAPAPWLRVVTDITEFKVGGGKAYLSAVVDCFDGAPASWSISRHPDSELADSSLRACLERRPAGSGPLLEHSDGGSTYRSRSWKRLCRENGVRRSMSRKGCCPDNARAEGFFGAVKEEFYNGADWSGVPYEQFARELDAYLEWYVGGRLKAFPDGYETIAARRRRLGYTV